MFIEYNSGCDGFFHIIKNGNDFWLFDEECIEKNKIHLHKIAKVDDKWQIVNSAWYGVENLKQLAQFDGFKGAVCAFNLGYHRCDYEALDEFDESFDYIVKNCFNIKLTDADWILNECVY